MANEKIRKNYKDIADAIRHKTGEQGGIKAEEMPAKIEGIELGVDTSICMNFNELLLEPYALRAFTKEDDWQGEWEWYAGCLLDFIKYSGKWYAHVPLRNEDLDKSEDGWEECIITSIEATSENSVDICGFLLKHRDIEFNKSLSLEVDAETGDGRIVWGSDDAMLWSNDEDAMPAEEFFNSLIGN